MLGKLIKYDLRASAKICGFPARMRCSPFAGHGPPGLSRACGNAYRSHHSYVSTGDIPDLSTFTLHKPADHFPVLPESFQQGRVFKLDTPCIRDYPPVGKDHFRLPTRSTRYDHHIRRNPSSCDRQECHGSIQACCPRNDRSARHVSWNFCTLYFYFQPDRMYRHCAHDLFQHLRGTAFPRASGPVRDCRIFYHQFRGADNYICDYDSVRSV